VYDREYAGKTVNFEASGGLLHSSLVMQDRETDTYWSIMKGEAIGGELKGEPLVELPVGSKMQWKDWVQLHPDTLILSVRGREDVPVNPYDDYFQDNDGFRGTRAKDSRLETKDPIYAFQYGGKPYAVPVRVVEDGKVFGLSTGEKLFFYRPKNAPLFQSTAAFVSRGKGFEKKGSVWIELDSGARFNEDKNEFQGDGVQALSGFDTFWYNWSLTNPDTELLR
jgi:hypothetical protein